jgi:hypothetical protein
MENFSEVQAIAAAMQLALPGSFFLYRIYDQLVFLD